MQFMAVAIDQDGPDTGQREGSGAGLGGDGAGQWADQDPTGLGLPPGVDDRTAMLANNPIVPQPCFGIDRLTDGTEDAQRSA